MRTVAFLALVLSAVSLGCADDGGSGVTQGKPPGPPDSTTSEATTSDPSTTAPGSSTSTPAEACCEPDGDAVVCSPCSDESQVCVARRFFGEEPSADDFGCQDACVPNVAAAYWCAGDDSCCDADATCDAQGFCRVAGDESTTGGETTSSSSSSSGGDSSSSSSSSSGGSSSSSSSSSTGAM